MTVRNHVHRYAFFVFFSAVLFLLTACGPLIIPESGPNSDRFPPKYTHVAWTAELSRFPDGDLPFDPNQLQSAGSIDVIRVENGRVDIDGWAPVTESGVLWVGGFRDSQATILGVEGRWRPDVANAVSAEFMGSGFSVSVGDVVFEQGDPVCVVAQTQQEWFLLVGSDAMRCGLSKGEEG